MTKGVKKVGLITRERIVEDLKEKINGSSGCFFIGFNKVGAFGFNKLRNELAKAGAKIFITKNSLFKRAFKDLDWKDSDDILDKETGAVLVYDDDVVKTCKIIVDFAKESETLQVKGATIQEKKIGPKDVQAMAKLPPRETLLAMAVSGLAAPITGFATCLNQVILKFVWVVAEIRKTKDQADKK
ncbi:MAG: 50S ribosomal protein L10 [Candidatus Omnitrophica bacterium]|nr:50S ribosomal protein L10 [Candidatus Omnitrophota bacterium]